MVEIDEALRLVLQHARPLPGATVPLAAAAGMVLACDVTSDIDSPPHDKALVDGYALHAADLATGIAELAVLEEVTAGQLPTRTVVPGTATRVMTGAPLPPGANAVAMIECATLVQRPGEAERVRLECSPPAEGANIMRQGLSLRRGQRALAAGTRLRPIEIGILAEVGAERVPVIPLPSVALLVTGNELTSVGEQPAAGKIRNSNGPMLRALAASAGASPLDLGIGRDDPRELERLVGQGLESHVLLISGGVSAGVLDLTPRILNDLGVRQVFHKVRFKPGQPLWFGTLERGGQATLVFGLPGNPVSVLACFEVFVRPALEQMAGRTLAAPPAGPREETAVLSQDFSHRGNRPTYHPARLEVTAAGNRVTPLVWQGSADLATLTHANAFALFAAGQKNYEAGETIRVRRLEG